MGYLKTGRALIESINETVDLIELNALAEGLIVDAHTKGDMLTAATTAVKYGTVKWAETDVEVIKTEMSSAMIYEIAEKISALSGMGIDPAKKSKPVKRSDSSID